MMGSSLLMLGVGLLCLFVGFGSAQNIRDAIKTGVAQDRSGQYGRRKNPMLYKLVLGGNVFASVVFSLVGMACMGLGVFLLINSN